ncbi:bifunctional 3,4-dihydroxy-2-butanone-4-phosphate synthase/GTP cyclohydrolase II [Natranaerobius trueperi]|uniref:Riboflavin biosynthesis protein RibBA n=1 Tax=Natranaerobius trueperi TaxID=759412 RepID=A0A226C1R6_9FIRM|nr:bifunctional 3,4-dihydroxy-2-butanone-4-phosphate synthase/GTP cyclohydrolase II [Natranaerobius trueperi]OWZ84544.1 bifunctional 3,4-dihydroxy-2-butanone-4-phosphate synthase/GTP cyclohydrolase II [Natranaerobius trueperi]
MALNTIHEALEDLKNGKMVIVVDDEDRENEGDLVIPADKATPEAVNFMAKYGRGLICMPMKNERIDELEIPLMVENNTDDMGTAFTVSVDAKECHTGISAYERSLTISKLIDPNTRPEDLTRPGHIFPLAAKSGGVLKRAGHTEAAIDLAYLSGSYPAGVICEIMSDDGTMARLPELEEFAQEHDLKIISIADLISYRRQSEKLVEKVADVNLPSRYGQFKGKLYQDTVTREHHLAIVKGDLHKTDEPVIVRVHSECLTGDVLGSMRCDCGDQLATALRKIEEEGVGVVLYMRQEGRGIGLANKLKAYELQDQGKDTVEANELLGFPADLRDYGIGAQMLKELGLKKISLLTNNPKKIIGLKGYGLEVEKRMSLEPEVNPHNECYLKTKQEKLGHMLEIKENREDD